MPIWRPANTITVKALALIWQDDALLRSDVYDDSGRIPVARPPSIAPDYGDRHMASILTNTSAMVALQNLRTINSNLVDTQSQIATGKKIANARDNATVWMTFALEE